MKFNKKLLIPVLVLIVLTSFVLAQTTFGDITGGISDVWSKVQDPIFLGTLVMTAIALYLVSSKSRVLGEGVGQKVTIIVCILLAFWIVDLRLGQRGGTSAWLIYGSIILLTFIFKPTDKYGSTESSARIGAETIFIYAIPSALMAPFWSIAAGNKITGPLIFGSFFAHIVIAFLFAEPINMWRRHKEENKNPEGETIRGTIKGNIIGWIKSFRKENKNLKNKKKDADDGAKDDKNTAKDLKVVEGEVGDVSDKSTSEKKEKVVKDIYKALPKEGEEKENIKLKETDPKEIHKEAEENIEAKKLALKKLQNKRDYILGTPQGRIAKYLIELRTRLFKKVGEEKYDEKRGKNVTKKAINWEFWHGFTGESWDNPAEFIKEIEDAAKDKRSTNHIIKKYADLIKPGEETPINVDKIIIQKEIKKIARKRREYIKTLEKNLPESVEKHNNAVQDCKKVDDILKIINNLTDQNKRLTDKINQLSETIRKYSAVLLRKDTSLEDDRKIMEWLRKRALSELHKLVEERRTTNEIKSHDISRAIEFLGKAEESIIEAKILDNPAVLQAIFAALGMEVARKMSTLGTPVKAEWSEVKE